MTFKTRWARTGCVVLGASIIRWNIHYFDLNIVDIPIDVSEAGSSGPFLIIRLTAASKPAGTIYVDARITELFNRRTGRSGIMRITK